MRLPSLLSSLMRRCAALTLAVAAFAAAGAALAAGVTFKTWPTRLYTPPQFLLWNQLAVAADGRLVGPYTVSRGVVGGSSVRLESGLARISVDGSGFSTVPTSGTRTLAPTTTLARDSQGRFHMGAACQDTVFVTGVGGVPNFETLYSFGSELAAASRLSTEAVRPRCDVRALTLDAGDNLYLADMGNGSNPAATTDSDGAIWRLSPDGASFTLLRAFNAASTDASRPEGRSPIELRASPDGWLYGLNALGGLNGQGTLYRMRPDGTQFSVLHHFTRATEGAFSAASGYANLVEAPDGHLYGTLSQGGPGSNGGIWRIARDGSNFSMLHSSYGMPDVRQLQRLVLAGDGNLYALSSRGGVNDQGALVRIVVADAGGPTGGYEMLHSFANTGTGQGAQVSRLLSHPNGKLYAVQSFYSDPANFIFGGTDLVEIDIGYVPVNLELSSFAVGPGTIIQGGTVTASWSALNATSCTAGGGWSGSRNASGGNEVLTPAGLGTTTYSLSCTNGSTTVQKTATVLVTAPVDARITSFTASPSTLEAGNTTTLAWTTEGASACTASGAWSGARSRNGSEALWLSATGTVTYTLSCTGTGAPGTATVAVAVTPRGRAFIDASSNGGGSLSPGLIALIFSILFIQLKGLSMKNLKRTLALALSCAMLAGPLHAAGAATVTVMHAFTGAANDGALPTSPPVYHAAGARLYGATSYGGTAPNPTVPAVPYTGGVAYSLKPLADASARDYLSSYLGINANNKRASVASVAGTSAGVFYTGISNTELVSFGAAGLTPAPVETSTATHRGLWTVDANSASAYKDKLFFFRMASDEPVLMRLDGAAGVELKRWPSAAGAQPSAVIASSDGWLYGVINNYTADLVATAEVASIFRIKPDGTLFEVMTRFTATTGFPIVNATGQIYSGIVDGGDGWLYGTTFSKDATGSFSVPTSKLGTVYRISKSLKNGDDSFKLEVLHDFAGGTADGAAAAGPLVLAADGNVYGTTREGGAGASGAVFRIVLADAANPAKAFGYELLHSFTEAVDGKTPVGLSPGEPYALYGATRTGGANTGAQTSGTLFRIELPKPASITAFSAANSSVVEKSPVNITWATADASSCSAGGNNAGAWTGARATSGSNVPTGLLTQLGTNTFTLSCLGSVGSTTATQTVSVIVTAAPGTVTPTTPTAPAADSGSSGGGSLAWLLIPLAMLGLSRRLRLAAAQS